MLEALASYIGLQMESGVESTKKRKESVKEPGETTPSQAAKRPRIDEASTSKETSNDGGESSSLSTTSNLEGTSAQRPNLGDVEQELEIMQDVSTAHRPEKEDIASTLFKPPSQVRENEFTLNDIITDYSLPFFYKELSSDDAKKMKEEIGRPSNEFFAVPKVNEMLLRNKTVKDDKGLKGGDDILSEIQSKVLTACFPLMQVWQPMLCGEEITEAEALSAIQRSIALLGSAFASITSFRRYRFRRLIKQDFESVCKNNTDGKPCKHLFGDDLPSQIKKISEENKLFKSSTQTSVKNQKSFPANKKQFKPYNGKFATNQKANRRVFFNQNKSNQDKADKSRDTKNA